MTQSIWRASKSNCPRSFVSHLKIGHAYRTNANYHTPADYINGFVNKIEPRPHKEPIVSLSKSEKSPANESNLSFDKEERVDGILTILRKTNDFWSISHGQ